MSVKLKGGQTRKEELRVSGNGGGVKLEMFLGGVNSGVNWDESFLAIAEAVALKSKDLGEHGNGQVGAVLVSPDKLIISTGFNGLARGLSDVQSLLNDSENKEEKFRWVCHAEANAIFNAARSGVSAKGTTIYVTKFPCFECLKAIIQAGVVRLYTHDDGFWPGDPSDPKQEDREHPRKLELLRQDLIKVDAPFFAALRPRSQSVLARVFEEKKTKAPDHTTGIDEQAA